MFDSDELTELLIDVYGFEEHIPFKQWIFVNDDFVDVLMVDDTRVTLTTPEGAVDYTDPQQLYDVIALMFE